MYQTETPQNGLALEQRVTVTSGPFKGQTGIITEFYLSFFAGLHMATLDTSPHGTMLTTIEVNIDYLIPA